MGDDDVQHQLPHHEKKWFKIKGWWWTEWNDAWWWWSSDDKRWVKSKGKHHQTTHGSAEGPSAEGQVPTVYLAMDQGTLEDRDVPLPQSLEGPRIPFGLE